MYLDRMDGPQQRDDASFASLQAIMHGQLLRWFGSQLPAGFEGAAFGIVERIPAADYGLPIWQRLAAQVSDLVLQ